MRSTVMEPVREASDETDSGPSAENCPPACENSQCRKELSELCTGSLNTTVASLSPVILASNTGAMPSDTGTLARAASALDDESVTAPEPEPESVPTSAPDVSYLSSTPSGPVSAKSPESVRTTVVEPDETSELAVMWREAESVPDIDQPSPV